MSVNQRNLFVSHAPPYLLSPVTGNGKHILVGDPGIWLETSQAHFGFLSKFVVFLYGHRTLEQEPKTR